MLMIDNTGKGVVQHVEYDTDQENAGSISTGAIRQTQSGAAAASILSAFIQQPKHTSIFKDSS